MKPVTGFMAGALICLAQPMQARDIDAGTKWHDAAVTLLDVEFGDSGFHARWEYFQCICGDVLIRMEQTAPDGVQTGELLLVDGRAIAARGMVAQSADLEMMLQAPTLMVQLSFGLLQRAMPGGPAVVTAEREIAVEELQTSVEIDTGAAAGSFAAPWSLTGRVWPVGTARRRFDLVFEFSGQQPGAPGGRFGITGGQEYGGTSFPLAEETLLEGWKVQWITGESSTPVDPSAGLTLGGLRVEARERSQTP